MIYARSQYIFNVNLDFRKSTGITTRNCVFCGSDRIKLYPGVWLSLPYEIPACAKQYEDQMHRRDNGICLDCGLEQSFYKFSEAGRRVFYDLGLDTLSEGNNFKTYPPSPQWIEHLHQIWYSKRLPKWDEYLQKHKIKKLEKVLHIRCVYGNILQHFGEKYGAKLWGMDMVHNCTRYIREHIPSIHILEGDLAATIEVDPTVELKFDLIVCFHTITHSVEITRDLKTLQSLLSDNGIIIFCDEISKKFNNPFHMIHPDEKMFVHMLSKFFARVDRIDNARPPVPHAVAPYTLKGDNPDIVAWKHYR
ncbi:MAG: class I SAM-dependent methyltransferase [Xenococcaceae cyanobacterium]